MTQRYTYSTNVEVSSGDDCGPDFDIVHQAHPSEGELMNRPILKAVSNTMTPAEMAMQREAEAKALVLAECRAVEADARALLARCEQLGRLSNVPPGYAGAVRDLANAMNLRVPTMTGILTTQDS